MARRKKRSVEFLDYHEGLSYNQTKLILREVDLDDKPFFKWLSGQTCPVIPRHNRHNGKLEQKGGVYEYDLFRWIANQKKGKSVSGVKLKALADGYKGYV